MRIYPHFKRNTITLTTIKTPDSIYIGLIPYEIISYQITIAKFI